MEPPKIARRDLAGHRKAVLSLAWSPNGRRLASASADESVRTWAIDPSAGAKPERSEISLLGQGGPVVAVEWHPKRDDQVASLTDKYLRIWDLRAASKPTHAISIGGASHMSWHPDGHVVAVSSYKQNDITFADVRKGAVLGQHTFHDQYPGPVKFLGNGSVLLVGCTTGDIDVVRVRHDCRGGESVATLQGHVQDCTAIAVDARSDYVASAGYDALVTFWDIAAATAVATVPAIEYAVTSVDFSPDGARLAIAQEKGPIVVVAAPSGRREAEVDAAASHAVRWNPRHPHILAFGSDSRDVWNAEGRHTDAGGTVGLAFFGSSGGGGGGGGDRSGRGGR
ncbi:THO complex subunit 3 [Raphidocelis subcapitata]|uniref:THO complex subunit 3 n=1 Tax=Raphidocelis subcapitata TaxID=307507 RepID=A0A2V0P7Y4_9CHLO|nr:THO complex subunit 3 [Raphidocelis subcapitata]|eukprot:GBF93287.1 THO complex subunit 3 [Raphidocelis subcapitata]